MKKGIVLLACLLCLLSGCSLLDGNYYSVAPHKVQKTPVLPDAVIASNYSELVQNLKELVANVTQTAVITVEDYPEEELEQGMESAIRMLKYQYPLGAYGVEDILWEKGVSVGQKAVAVTIKYRYNPNVLRKVRHYGDMEAAIRGVTQSLENYDATMLLFIDNYKETDFPQLVKLVAADHPQLVMETPHVTQTNYGAGTSRLVELIFDYQNSRDALIQMQSQVKPVYEAAILYVAGEGSQSQKFSQLYAFLMERFQYTYETSITPAYSLLRHGVGDSRAFATMYAAMCRGAGLECETVTGTYAGEPRIWNRIFLEDAYYHVDLLCCSEEGMFRPRTDEEMSGYVWDYSAYEEN